MLELHLILDLELIMILIPHLLHLTRILLLLRIQAYATLSFSPASYISSASTSNSPFSSHRKPVKHGIPIIHFHFTILTRRSLFLDFLSLLRHPKKFLILSDLLFFLYTRKTILWSLYVTYTMNRSTKRTKHYSNEIRLCPSTDLQLSRCLTGEGIELGPVLTLGRLPSCKLRAPFATHLIKSTSGSEKEYIRI